MAKERVVVVGAGFAGLNVAKRLQERCHVTLVAPSDRFVYLPLIHEVLSEHVLPGDVTRRLADVLPRCEIVRDRGARVVDKTLETVGGESVPFDKLVVAVGAEPNDFGVPGVKEHTHSFYSVGDALRANAALKTAAAHAADVGTTVRVVVVGAAFTGVEVAGEAAELLPKLEVPSEITLLDALPEVFPRQSKAFRDGIMDGLQRTKIGLRLNQKITGVEPGMVRIADGSVVPSDVTFWCAGVKPRGLDGVDSRVHPTLVSMERDDVFVVGDAAGFPREAGVPKLAQTAEAQADVVAHNILHPDHLQDYRPDVKGIIVSIGQKHAVAEMANGTVFKGVVPWRIKRSLYKAKIALT